MALHYESIKSFQFASCDNLAAALTSFPESAEISIVPADKDRTYKLKTTGSVRVWIAADKTCRACVYPRTVHREFAAHIIENAVFSPLIKSLRVRTDGNNSADLNLSQYTNLGEEEAVRRAHIPHRGSSLNADNDANTTAQIANTNAAIASQHQEIATLRQQNLESRIREDEFGRDMLAQLKLVTEALGRVHEELAKNNRDLETIRNVDLQTLRTDITRLVTRVAVIEQRQARESAPASDLLNGKEVQRSPFK